MLSSAMRALPLVFLLGCAAAPAPRAPESTAATLPKYRVVHVDTLDPEKAASFMEARKDWVAELRRAGTSDRRGTFLEVDGRSFYTVRPLERFGDLDGRGAEIARALEKLKEAQKRYDDKSDAALVYPHRNEIWRVDDDLGYAPATGALNETTAACGRMIIEEPRADPVSEKRYEDAWAETRRALVEARYPLTRVTFGSVFGAGKLVSLWLAPSPEALRNAETVDAAVARVRGEARAKELAEATQGALVGHETHEVVRRADLTSP
jgi:hypothetical protein